MELSLTYQNELDATVQEFSKAMGKSDKSYSLFYPAIGKLYHKSRDLIVFGQATNGWEPHWKTSEIKKSNKDLIKKSSDYSSEDGDKCPLEWINENWSDSKLYRSFFWNVTYKLVKAHYDKTDENWNNFIVWSNLMKIAPAEWANPDEAEIQAQLEGAAKLFKLELSELRPRNALIITNLKTWADPLLQQCSISYEKVNDNYVEALADYKECNIIVTKRPFIGKHEPFIKEIRKYLK